MSPVPVKTFPWRRRVGWAALLLGGVMLTAGLFAEVPVYYAVPKEGSEAETLVNLVGGAAGADAETSGDVDDLFAEFEAEIDAEMEQAVAAGEAPLEAADPTLQEAAEALDPEDVSGPPEEEWRPDLAREPVQMSERLVFEHATGSQLTRRDGKIFRLYEGDERPAQLCPT